MFFLFTSERVCSAEKVKDTGHEKALSRAKKGFFIISNQLTHDGQF